MGYLKGWVYVSLWYSSIVAGYITLFCPVLPALLISNRLYRYLTDVFLTFWQTYPTALLELICGCQVQIYGDVIDANETSILIMNHRTRTDWNFLWPALYHCTAGPGRYKHSTKFVLKDVIRHIPGIGWVMQLACFIYVKRNWREDRQIIGGILDYFCKMAYKYTLLIFPEGTDLTPNTKRMSDSFAEQHQLTKYNYVLHPRTTGFAFVASTLLEKNCLDAIYDVTLVYPDVVPQTEKKLFVFGEFPREVKMHFTRYPTAVLPRDEDQLGQFLERRWREKEQILAEFHATGGFLHGKIIQRSHMRELYFSLVFWTLLPLITAYLLYNFTYFRLAIVAHTLLLLLLNLTGDGFPHFETTCFNWRAHFKRGCCNTLNPLM